jgi:hypothetical protein
MGGGAQGQGRVPQSTLGVDKTESSGGARQVLRRGLLNSRLRSASVLVCRSMRLELDRASGEGGEVRREWFCGQGGSRFGAGLEDLMARFVVTATGVLAGASKQTMVRAYEFIEFTGV